MAAGKEESNNPTSPQYTHISNTTAANTFTDIYIAIKPEQHRLPTRLLTPQPTTLPIKLQKLKKHVNIVKGQFNVFTLETPQNPQEPDETIIVDVKCGSSSINTNESVDFPNTNAETLFTSLSTCLDDFMATESVEIPQIFTTPVKVIHKGKDITAARKQFEEQETETEAKKAKKTPARKQKRECGRPTTDQQLTRMDEDFNDLQALQLTRRELTLPDARGKCKKSRKILTKLPHDIVVDTMREYQTYELFADTRTKALQDIQEKRELLEKINAPEYVLSTLLKKRNDSDSST
ncbi:Hypothetical predicted protein [Paramuricea clavata]|uniref:Uncharacterized protein n=1 Tax=Paramuricea clavata TaxID=317549 RepID=A0A7D9DEL8_PARCT|nr:Hypothetical predicted protein [Paramuricea clavata]